MQIDAVHAEFAAAMEMFKKFQEKTSMTFGEAVTKEDVKEGADPMTSDLPVSKAIDDMYPCMLAMLGSAFGFMQVVSLLL